MKIDTLAFLNVLLKHHKPEVFHKHIQVLLPAVINAVSDSFYKITSEALLVLTQMVNVIRPLRDTKSQLFYFIRSFLIIFYNFL